jgi:cyclopropane-fatty-acyl-phospholipid synthase
MNYSCGYWKTAKNLTEAQIAKMELIAQKLCLKPGMKVLDIGCGWGGLCQYLAKNYKVSVVGITISKEQAALAEERCQGLPVEIKLVDYR